MAHVAQYKKDTVKEFIKLIKEYPIIGAVNMEGMPTPQLQNMRASLRDICVIKMAKRRLLMLAIETAKKDKQGIEEIEQFLRGMPALLFTKENPFRLFRTLQKSKSPAPAKAGQTAPNDIKIPAGPTPFAPGPVIGELGALGIKTGVENGKVAIKEDSVVCREGEKISAPLAGMLTRLGIEPMEVGLDLVAVYENGTIYKKDVLAINEEEFLNKVNDAARWAFNLSVEASYPTKDNITLLITKSFQESKALALEADILADMVVEDVLAKAERQMLSLKETAGIKTEARPAEEKKEEKAESPAEGGKTEKEVKEEDQAAEEDEKTEEELKEELAELEKEVAEEEKKEKETSEDDKKKDDKREDISAENIKKELEFPEEFEEKEEEPQPEEKTEEVEDKVEEEKPVETPKEEPKIEETPAPEEPKEAVIEEPKIGEANEPTEKDVHEVVEEVKAEKKVEKDIKELDKELKKEIEDAPEEEKAEIAEQAGKIEEKVAEEVKEESPSAEEKAEDLKEKVEEIKEAVKEKKIDKIREEVEEIKEEIMEEIKDPKEKDIKKISKEIKEVSREIKEMEVVPSARELAAKKPKDTKKESEQVENLFEQLKKKGTLRGVSAGDKKPKKALRAGGVLTPEEIVAQARTRMASKNKAEKVPTAHELLEKKKKALRK